MLKNTPLKLVIIAIVLILVSFPLPYWTVIMDAPTYPTRNLSMRVYLTYFEGDIDEWNVVGNFVGVKVPPPIPEEVFTIVPIAVGLVVLLSILSIIKPQLLKFTIWGPWVVLTALAAWTQYSLYLFGHDLDPNAPLRVLKPFTPPVIGVIQIYSLTTYHLPHVGSFLFVTAGILLFLANRKLKKENQVAEAA